MAELFSHGVEVGGFVDGLKPAGVEFCAYVTDTCGGKYVITINNGSVGIWKTR